MTNAVRHTMRQLCSRSPTGITSCDVVVDNRKRNRTIFKNRLRMRRININGLPIIISLQVDVTVPNPNQPSDEDVDFLFQAMENKLTRSDWLIPFVSCAGRLLRPLRGPMPVISETSDVEYNSVW